MSAQARPRPEPAAAEYADHLAGLDRGELVLRRCEACARVQWPPRALCAGCGGSGWAPHPVEPVGEVHTFTVVRRAFHPWFAARVPYAVAIVDLAGADVSGLRVTGLHDDPDAVAVGQPVRGRVEEQGGSPALVWGAR